MSKVVSLSLNEKLIRIIEQLAQEKDTSKSQIANSLIELGIQRKEAIELIQNNKLNKLELSFKDELNKTKDELSLNIAYKLEKLEDRLNEIQSKLDKLDKLSLILDEILFHAVYTQKLLANYTVFTKTFSEDDVLKIKEIAKDNIDKFKKVLGGEA